MVKALVIVAHPDDETLWMGGYILENKSWEWHVASLCRANDKDRAPKFRKVCASLGAKCVIADLEDETLQPLTTDAVIQKIKGILPSNKFNYIFTHGENGEYGHIRHKEIHQAVKNMLKTKELQCDKIVYFSYDIQGDIFNIGKNANLVFTIPSSLKIMKKRLVNEVYGFKEGIFESNLCNMQQESFSMENIK
ncbi:hypothetical protein A2995_00815 [Candidatus Nomurabacteria bacterium RIFCSPLOWO2_01_FULL_33_24]|uniref:GlcNAc-PI de-N-acetylase n=1 Tax=Candidatus Nomurabacteria bacterium RIFCSPLOWO2_01_FULL_33_24 TaxID=1801765 RepID=A0A1F6X2Z0_9BACT|nr:MAG: hypothetical protein A2995_00815 [Candidatus Nomurabacteria bacterium RIFCSPLOWO2_01_FULL_33_24]